MALKAGDKLGPYEIVSPIGKGGMGEVWKARDPRLNRDVAIKISAQQFTDRFEREAHAIAALNHANICTLHDVGPNYLVMELVEGPTLAERIAEGPVPLEAALTIAKQIADALEAAHEKGIVHRDLKPANIKIKPDGQVKVLDFGLAKSAAEETPLTPDSPTMLTVHGMILGTAGYMAPEQAAGQPVDKRADVWAFGVVLYEVLTGQRLFQGDSVAHILADVLRGPIDLDKLPKGTPRRIRNLMKRCLDRDLRTRLRDIREARIAIDSADEEPEQSAARPAGRPRMAWALAAAGMLAALGLGVVHFREKPLERQSARFQIAPPEKTSFGMFHLSPDGRYLAFAAGGKLWVRALDSLQPQALPGTEGASFPFWSPDNGFIGFFAQGKLKKIAVTGGPPVTLCDAGVGRGGTWNRDGIIVFSNQTPALQRVPATGGVAVPMTSGAISGAIKGYPEFLPDGQHFLHVASGVAEKSGIYAGSLDGITPVRVVPDRSSMLYVPPAASGQKGHLLFLRGSTLMAQPFDPAKLQTTGEVVLLAEQVGVIVNIYGAFSASENGVLAYGPGTSASSQELIWMDRTGKRLGSAGVPGDYRDFRLSPDGKKIVFDRSDASSSPDIWMLDTSRGVSSRLTFDPGVDNDPIWSPDGQRVLFPSNRSGVFDLYLKAASGADQEQVLVRLGTPTGWATDWSRDGKFVLYQIPGAKTGQDLWIAPQSPEQAAGVQKPLPYLQTPFDEQDGAFSPDGHWIAYFSNESGRDEVYVQSFPLSGAKFQISTAGGTEPHWRGDGTELYYVAADRNLMAVPVKTGAFFEAGVAKLLFPVPNNAGRHSYAVSGENQRFLVSVPAGGETAAPPLTVVLNWQAGLKK